MQHLSGQLLRLAGGCAVADGDVLNAVLADEAGEYAYGFGLFTGAEGRVHDRGVEHLAGAVDDGDLAAVGIAGVKPHRDLALHGRLHEQRLEVQAEILYRTLTGALGECCARFALERGVDQPVVGVLAGALHKFHRGGAGLHGGAAQHRKRRVAVEQYRDGEETLLFAAVDGEDLVVGELCDGLVEVVVQAVDGVLFLHRETAQVPLPHEQSAQRLADGRVVREELGDDVICALQGVGNCLYALFGVDEVCRGVLRTRAAALLRIEQLRQRLESLLAGDGRAGAALLLIGAVKILHLRERRGRVDGSGELRRELTLSVDSLFDLLTALVEIAQIRQAILEFSEGRVVHRAVQLLAVARDEGDGVALVEQLYDVIYMTLLAAKLAGEYLIYRFHGSLLCVSQDIIPQALRHCKENSPDDSIGAAAICTYLNA